MKASRLFTLNTVRGAALVELSIILPFLFLMALATFDYARAIHAKNIITNMSREGANLASRSGLDPTKAQYFMSAIANTAQPLTMPANGMIYISEVQGTNVSGSIQPRIINRYGWSQSTLSPVPASRIGSVGSNATNLGQLSDPNRLAVGQTIHVVEVFYVYRTLFSRFSGANKTLYNMTVF